MLFVIGTQRLLCLFSLFLYLGGFGHGVMRLQLCLGGTTGQWAAEFLDDALPKSIREHYLSVQGEANSRDLYT